MAILRKEGRRIHVGYSTNVHGSESMEEIHAFLDRFTVPVKDGIIPPDRSMGIDLRLGAALVRELDADSSALDGLRRRLDERGLYVFGINGFPLGDFQAPVVKTSVFEPSWLESERFENTLAMGSILARLLPEGVEGSVSTVAGGYRGHGDTPDHHRRMASTMVRAAEAFAKLSRNTGRTVTLSPEPEPDTTMEDLDSILSFYGNHVFPLARRLGPGGEDKIRKHLPVNLDACHMSVAFEDPREIIQALRSAGIRVGKSNVSCCPAVRDPARNAAGRRFLLALDEPRFLHQTWCKDALGVVRHRLPDLPAFRNLAAADLEEIAEVRTHFHIPLFGGGGQDFISTRNETVAFLHALLDLTDCPGFAVETYTWHVLGHTPLGEEAGCELAAGLRAEVGWTLNRLEDAGWTLE